MNANPTSTEIDTARADVRARLREMAAANATAAAAKAHRQRLDRDHADNVKKLADLIAAQDLDAAVRLVDPQTVEPVDPAIAAEIADLTKRVNARAAVTGLLDTKSAAAVKTTDAASLALADDVLTLTQLMRDREIQAISLAVAKLAPMLARLVAADDVQSDLIGDTPTFRGHDNLTSGRVVAHAFVTGLPEKLRSPGLDAASIDAAAANGAAIILNDFQGA